MLFFVVYIGVISVVFLIVIVAIILVVEVSATVLRIVFPKSWPPASLLIRRPISSYSKAVMR